MGAASGRQRNQLALFAVWCLLGVFILGFVAPLPPPAAAQEAPPAGEGAAAAPKEKPPEVSIFWHIITSAGWVFGLTLLGLSVALVTLIVLLAMDLRMGTSVPPYFVEEFTETINKRRFKEAFEMARNDNSILARIMVAGMGRLQYGIDDAREAALNTAESVKSGKEQLITYLATVGTLGPMIGLVGTVFGMILAFRTLTQSSTPDAQALAKDISHALVITLLGIGISVPAIFAHAFFRNRLIRLSMDASNIADDLLTQMYHNSKKPAPAADTRPVAAAAIKPAP